MVADDHDAAGNKRRDEWAPVHPSTHPIGRVTAGRCCDAARGCCDAGGEEEVVKEGCAEVAG